MSEQKEGRGKKRRTVKTGQQFSGKGVDRGRRKTEKGHHMSMRKTRERQREREEKGGQSKGGWRRDREAGRKRGDCRL